MFTVRNSRVNVDDDIICILGAMAKQLWVLGQKKNIVGVWSQ